MSLHSNLPKRAVLSFALATALIAPAVHAADSGKALAMSQARGLIAGHLGALQGNSEDSFNARDAIVDRDGTEHVRFDRSFRGLRVIGGDVVVKSQRGQLRSALLTLRSTQRPSLTPRLSKDDAAVEAGARFGSRVEQVRGNEPVVYARGAKPVLAYEVIVQGEANDRHSGLMSYYIDATSGKVLDVQDLIQTVAATGTGKSLYYGNLSISTDQKSASKYDLIDTTRGSGSVYDAKGGVVSGLFDIISTISNATLMSDTDNVWGNNTTGDGATVAVDIHYGVGVTWDYYKNVHGRSGLAGDGKGISSYAHTNFKTSTGATSGANAAYVDLVKSMFYGDGDAARGYGPIVGIDVAGHEMTHGVTAATSKLAYSGDAGGLNEAASDIMGTLVEFYANNASDPGDYRIGEKMRTDGKAFRDMYNQAADGKSFNCYITGGFDPTLSDGAHNPHYTSGVGNLFFYFLAEGSVAPAGTGLNPAQMACNGDAGMAGIGRDKAGKIWYRALTAKFTSNTTYPQARAATLAAAGELYGTGSVEQNAVARAWTAVKVN